MKLLALLLALGITKPVATISAVVAGGNAHINVRFAAEGEEVQISLSGGDGLKVAGDETPIKGRAVSKGERITLDTAYVPGPDQSSLTVEVTGRFAGETKTVTQTFKVGMPSNEQRQRTYDRATNQGN